MTKEAAQTVNRILWYLFGLLEVLLAFRLIFKLLGANPASGFVQFIYTVSGPFVMPFNAIFPEPVTNGSILESSTVVALVVYAVITYLVTEFVFVVKPEAEVQSQEEAPKTPQL